MPYPTTTINIKYFIHYHILICFKTLTKFVSPNTYTYYCIHHSSPKLSQSPKQPKHNALHILISRDLHFCDITIKSRHSGYSATGLVSYPTDVILYPYIYIHVKSVCMCLCNLMQGEHVMFLGRLLTL